MKIRIEDDRLLVRGLWGVKFSASSEEIIELRFWAERKYYGPKILVWLIGGDKLFLRAAMVWTAKGGFTLDVTRDKKAFADAIAWFREKGWDVDEGIRLAFQTPLVRTTVPKR